MSNPNRHGEFTELIRQHHGRLVGYVFAMVRDFDDTQDIVQQTCLTLWEKFDTFETGTNFGAWACEVARMKVLNFLRTQGRQRLLFGEEFIAELAAIEASLGDQAYRRREALSACVEKLPEKQRNLLWRCYGGKETIKQVAEDLRRTTDGIYGSLRNIRRKLMECIEQTLRREVRT